jgi:hypothetical protein
MFVESLANKTAKIIDRWKYLLLVVCTVCYALITGYAAQRKLFWFDELFTIHISRLSSLRLMWDALIHGADFNPPLLYVLTHFSEAILGHGRLRARLPEIAAFWIFCVCLFRFVSIRSSALAGFISLGFPLITTAYLYAFEARSHGVVLGFCGLSLISWQALTTAKRGRFWLALGLFGSLAAALLTHSYAFLLFLPLVAGELARSILEKRKDWIVWLALIGSSPAILVSLPLLHSMRSRAGVGVFLPPSVTKLLESYDHLLGPATTFTMFVLALICLDFLSRRGAPVGHSSAASRNVREHRFETHEKVALVGFLTIPFFSYVAARLSGSPMMDRYSLATIAGIAALLGIAAGRRAVTGVLVLTVLGAVLARQFMNFVYASDMREPSTGLMISTSQGAFMERYHLMSSGEDNRLPIVLLDYLEFAPSLFYAPPEIAPRLVYLTEGDNTNALGYKVLQDCCRAIGKATTLDEILATTNIFMIYSPNYAYSMLNRFVENGGTISIQNVTGDHTLFRVTYPSR